MIYFDNAATTKPDDVALKGMLPFLKEEYANSFALYSFARATKQAMKTARQKVAQCMNASENQIYFTSGGTEGDNFAVKGAFDFSKQKQAIIIGNIEHKAVFNSAEFLKKQGVKVFYAKADKNSIITPEALEDAIQKAKDYDTKLISIMTANNETGSVQPIKDLCKIAKKHNILFHTDAVQAAGHIPLDVKDSCIDILTASAHKFNGPKGAGFMYVKEQNSFAPLMHGGLQENNMRAGTHNTSGIVGLSLALEENCKNLLQNQRHLLSLEDTLQKGLRDANIDFKRNGTNCLPGFLSLSFRGQNAENLLHRLDLMGICVSVGAACNAGQKDISYVLRNIGLKEKEAKSTIRISLGKNNNTQEIEDFVIALKKIYAIL